MFHRYPYYYRKGQIKSLDRLKTPTMDDVSTWVEKMSQIKYYNDYDVYLFGSLSQGYSNPSDMDILFTGGEFDPIVIRHLLDSGMRVGINEIGVYTDIFYIPDITYLNLPYNRVLNPPYSIYTSYDIHIEIIDGELKTFRDYQVETTNGLFEFKHGGMATKAIQRNYTPSKQIKLSL